MISSSSRNDSLKNNIAASFIFGSLNLPILFGNAVGFETTHAASIGILLFFITTTIYIATTNQKIFFSFAFLGPCFLIFAWWLFVLVVWGEISPLGLGRLVSVGVNFLLLPILLFSVIKSKFEAEIFLRWFVIALLIYFLLSNISNPINASNIIAPFFVRYDGLVGVNEHGIIAVIALMATLSTNIPTLIKASIGVYLFLNLYVTGSRAAIIGLIVYIFFNFSVTAKLITMMTVAMMAVVAYSMLGNDLLTLLRFDEYSVTQRAAPLEFAINLIHNNSGLPFGLAIMNESLRLEKVDNTFLNMAVEAGVFGTILVVIFLVSLLRWTRKVKASRHYIYKNNHDRMIYIIPALLVHAIFETMLFSSMNITTIAFWLALAVYYRSRKPAIAKLKL